MDKSTEEGETKSIEGNESAQNKPPSPKRKLDEDGRDDAKKVRNGDSSEGKEEHAGNVSTGEEIDLLVLKCSACRMTYSEDRAPRNLSCGHSLCTACLNQRLSGERSCLECHVKQTVKDASELPINYPLLRLTKAKSIKEMNLGSIPMPTFPDDFPSTPDCHTGGGVCSAHGGSWVALCISCCQWICRDCMVIDHAVLPRGDCNVLGISEAMQKLKIDFQRRVDICLKDIKSSKLNLEHELKRHKLCLKYCLQDTKSHGLLVQEINKEVEELKKKDEAYLERAKEQLNDLLNKANENTLPEEFISSCKALASREENLKEYMSNEKSRSLKLRTDILTHLAMDIKQQLEKKTPVYALLEKDGKSKWAVITSSNDKDDRHCLLYSLKDEKPPNGSMIIPFDFVRDRIMEKPGVFFEIQHGDDEQGRVYVDMKSDSSLGLQVLQLCSGEIGSCYRNTCFYNYDSEIKALEGGDYQNNDGTGESIELDDMNDEDMPITSPGHVTCKDGETGKLQFHVEAAEENYQYDIGMVIDGLEILKASSLVTPITNAVIKDCGLLIPITEYKVPY